MKQYTEQDKERDLELVIGCLDFEIRQIKEQMKELQHMRGHYVFKLNQMRCAKIKADYKWVEEIDVR